MYGGDLENATYGIKTQEKNNNNSIYSKKSYPNSHHDDANVGSDYWLDEDLLDDDEYELFNNSTPSTHISVTPTVNNQSDDDNASLNDSSEPEADQLQLSDNAIKALMRPHQLHSIY